MEINIEEFLVLISEKTRLFPVPDSEKTKLYEILNDISCHIDYIFMKKCNLEAVVNGLDLDKSKQNDFVKEIERL
jgi:hypothetical protein